MLGETYCPAEDDPPEANDLKVSGLSKIKSPARTRHDNYLLQVWYRWRRTRVHDVPRLHRVSAHYTHGRLPTCRPRASFITNARTRATIHLMQGCQCTPRSTLPRRGSIPSLVSLQIHLRTSAAGSSSLRPFTVLVPERLFLSSRCGRASVSSSKQLPVITQNRTRHEEKIFEIGVMTDTSRGDGEVCPQFEASRTSVRMRSSQILPRVATWASQAG